MPLDSKPSPTPKLNKEWFLRHEVTYPIAVIFLIVLIIGSLLWVEASKKEKVVPEKENILSESSIENWQTYISEYGFEIKIPKDWVVEETIDYEPGGFFHTPIYFGPLNKGYSEFLNPNYVPMILIDVYQISDHNYDLNNNNYKGDLLGKNQEYAFINPLKPSHYNYFNNYADVPSDLRELAHLSLATFKNTNLTSYDTTTWKTYKNNKWKYEFKYPENVSVTSDQEAILEWDFTSPEDIILVSDKEGTFDLKIRKGMLDIEKKSVTLDRILSTFKVFEETTTNASWKTYIDKELGIEFKYPANWVIDIEWSLDIESYRKYRKINMHSYIYTTCWEDCGPDISFWLTDIKNLDEYIAKNSHDEYSFKDLQKTNFQGYNAYEFSDANTYTEFAILFEKDGKVYQFNFDADSKKELSETDNQILSTFKFTQ